MTIEVIKKIKRYGKTTRKVIFKGSVEWWANLRTVYYSTHGVPAPLDRVEQGLVCHGDLRVQVLRSALIPPSEVSNPRQGPSP